MGPNDNASGPDDGPAQGYALGAGKGYRRQVKELQVQTMALTQASNPAVGAVAVPSTLALQRMAPPDDPESFFQEFETNFEPSNHAAAV